jgi:hypothetical protein
MTMADLQETADRIAIRDLLDRYTLGVTRRDFDAMAACFHENARWHASVGYDFKTREGVRAGLREVVESMQFLLQMTHACVIDELTADSAKVQSVLNEFGKRDGEAGVFVLGIYYDRVTKVGGRWGFEERDFQLHYIDAGPPPGTITVDYAKQPY